LSSEDSCVWFTIKQLRLKIRICGFTTKQLRLKIRMFGFATKQLYYKTTEAEDKNAETEDSFNCTDQPNAVRPTNLLLAAANTICAPRC